VHLFDTYRLAYCSLCVVAYKICVLFLTSTLCIFVFNVHSHSHTAHCTLHACTHCCPLHEFLSKTGWVSGVCCRLSACITSAVLLQQQHSRVSEVPQPGCTRTVRSLCSCPEHLCKEHSRVLCHHLYTGHWRSVSVYNLCYL
jgi:hypothetical protein